MLEFMLSTSRNHEKAYWFLQFLFRNYSALPVIFYAKCLDRTYRADMMCSVFRWDKSATSKFQNIHIKEKEQWMAEPYWGLFERNLLLFISIPHYFGSWDPYMTEKKQYLVPLSLKASPDAQRKPILRKHVDIWGSEQNEYAGNDVYLVHCFTWSP